MLSIEDIIRVADAACMSRNAPAPTACRQPKNLPRARNFAAQRQQISAYIEGFLQARTQRPEHLKNWVPCW